MGIHKRGEIFFYLINVRRADRAANYFAFAGNVSCRLVCRIFTLSMVDPATFFNNIKM